MKRVLTIAMGAAMIVSGCGTYQGTGAYVGAQLGGILGSAIGGIGDGPRGADIGTVIGMAGGAVVGGAIGAQADQKRQADIDQYKRDRAERAESRRRRATTERQRSDSVADARADDSGYNATGTADDRLYDFNGSDYTGAYSAEEPTLLSPGANSAVTTARHDGVRHALELVNARFVDSNRDNVVSRGEVCKIIFEVMNRGAVPVNNIEPVVIEATGNRHIHISPSVHVETIAPGRGIRYTAILKADNRLGNGVIKVQASVISNGTVLTKVSEFNVRTVK